MPLIIKRKFSTQPLLLNFHFILSCTAHGHTRTQVHRPHTDTSICRISVAPIPSHTLTHRHTHLQTCSLHVETNTTLAHTHTHTHRYSHIPGLCSAATSASASRLKLLPKNLVSSNRALRGSFPDLQQI